MTSQRCTTKIGAEMYHILVLLYIVFVLSCSVIFICIIGKESQMFSCTLGQGEYVL